MSHFLNFLIFLHESSVLACKIFVASRTIFRCSTWALQLWLTSSEHAGSIVAAHRVSCSMAYGVLAPCPEMEPTSPALQGGFLTTELPGKSLWVTIIYMQFSQSTGTPWVCPRSVAWTGLEQISQKDALHKGLFLQRRRMPLVLGPDRKCGSLHWKVCVCARELWTNQIRSVAQSCPTLSDPMDCIIPGLPVHHQLLEFTQTHIHWVGDAIQPSHPVVPFFSRLQSFPASGSFRMSQLFTSGGESIRVSASTSVLPMNTRSDFL